MLIEELNKKLFDIKLRRKINQIENRSSSIKLEDSNCRDVNVRIKNKIRK